MLRPATAKATDLMPLGSPFTVALNWTEPEAPARKYLTRLTGASEERLATPGGLAVGEGFAVGGLPVVAKVAATAAAVVCGWVVGVLPELAELTEDAIADDATADDATADDATADDATADDATADDATADDATVEGTAGDPAALDENAAADEPGPADETAAEVEPPATEETAALDEYAAAEDPAPAATFADE